MPDLQDFAVTRASPGNLNTPRHVIAGRLVEGPATIADFTGDNVIRFPDVLATLSTEQQDELAGMLAQTIIQMKAGGS